eukprot:scaffold346373_cov40-Prasinocladus_malaysianus.AAC.1
MTQLRHRCKTWRMRGRGCSKTMKGFEQSWSAASKPCWATDQPHSHSRAPFNTTRCSRFGHLYHSFQLASNLIKANLLWCQPRTRATYAGGGVAVNVNV